MRKETQDQLDTIRSLEENWDGAGGLPFKESIIDYTKKLLDEIMRPDTALPDICPMSNGNIMIDWTKNNLEFTIEIDSQDLYVSFEGHTNSAHIHNLQMLADWITNP